jgi:hypothetical protein
MHSSLQFDSPACISVGVLIIAVSWMGSGRSRCVHLFACAFYRIKRDFSPDPEQVELFYSSRNVDQNVRDKEEGRRIY